MSDISNKLVEIGRIVFLIFGPCQGKIAIIIDIFDKNRCMIDGPAGRQIINIKRIKLTKIKLKINRGLKSKTVYQTLIKENIMRLWSKSKWGKTFFKKEKKKGFSDYEKFKYMIGKKFKRRVLPQSFRVTHKAKNSL